MGKEDVVSMCIYLCIHMCAHIHTMKYYSAVKKQKQKNKKTNENLPFPTTWMGLESIVLSERSQTEKDKYCTMSVLCGIPKIQQTSVYNKKETDLQI